MRCAIALAAVLVSCTLTGDVTVRASVAPKPIPTTAPTPSARPARTPVPTFLAPPTSSPAGSPATVASPDAGGPRGAQPPGALHYVAIGASDTFGVGSLDPAAGSWPSRIAALLPPGSTYRNLGVPGSLAAQAQRDQLPVAVREQPTIATVWLAVNDLDAQVPAQAYGATLGAILDSLVQGTPARVFVGNVPDLRAVPAYAAADGAVLLAQVHAYNAAIAAAAAKHAGRIVPVDLLTGSAELTSQITVSADGFHPSDAGYALIAQRFADAMRKSGVTLRAGP